jgi:hypothetical protein
MASVMFVFVRAEVSKKGIPNSCNESAPSVDLYLTFAKFLPSAVETCLAASKSHLLPMSTAGTKSLSLPC